MAKEVLYLENVTCNEFRQQQTVGIPITTYPVTVTYQNVSMPTAENNWHTPSAIVYSSADGNYAPLGQPVRNRYVQHCVTRSDAYGIQESCEDFIYESQHLPEWESWEQWLALNKAGTTCTVTAVRYEQYVLVRMENCGIIVKSTATLADSYKDKELYLSITGENCMMTDFMPVRETEAIEDGTITPLTYHKVAGDELEGDIPNIRCNGWWTAHSEGIEVGEKPIRITFDTISYILAKENWHAPLVVVFSALDKMVNGVAYSEFCVTRSDGFGWNVGADAYQFEANFAGDWTDWGAWLAANKAGVKNCTVEAVRVEDTIIMTQTNNGVTVKSVIKIPLNNNLPVCIALSGELCAISNIRIENVEE